MLLSKRLFLKLVLAFVCLLGNISKSESIPVHIQRFLYKTDRLGQHLKNGVYQSVGRNSLPPIEVKENKQHHRPEENYILNPLFSINLHSEKKARKRKPIFDSENKRISSPQGTGLNDILNKIEQNSKELSSDIQNLLLSPNLRSKYKHMHTFKPLRQHILDVILEEVNSAKQDLDTSTANTNSIREVFTKQPSSMKQIEWEKINNSDTTNLFEQKPKLWHEKESLQTTKRQNQATEKGIIPLFIYPALKGRYMPWPWKKNLLVSRHAYPKYKHCNV